MISNLEEILAVNVKGRKRSAIRELLKLTQKPEIISFAGGLPSPDSFPVAELKDVMNEVMDREANMVLQYGTTEGDPLLRQMLLDHYRQYGIDVFMDNVLVTTASQQGLDLVAKIFINRGDKVIVGLPSYLGGLGAFFSYGAVPVGIPVGDQGMDVKILEKTLEEMKEKGEKPKFIYIVPDFQNPAGITIPESRRKEILKLAYKYDVLIVEDSPYRELRFEGEHQRTFYELDETGHVILLGTFSKIFCPGFRIGWMLAHRDIIDRLIIAKQSTDLCTSPFTQRIVARFIEKGHLRKSINRIIEMYREKRDIMLDAFERYMPQGVKWTCPQGGLFLFLELPQGLDAEEIMKTAIEHNVAFVAGTHFFCNGQGKNTIRINFSYATKAQNVEGVRRLAGVFEEAIRNHKVKSGV